MAVEYEVHIPPKTTEINPVKAKEQTNEDVSYYETQVRKERAKRQFLEEKKMAEQIENPPEQNEPAFRVTGGVDLGHIDIQAQQKEARAEAERARTESAERVRKAEEERDKARQELQNVNIQHLQASLGGQIEQLKQAIAAGSRRDIVSELESIEAIAGKLGLSKSPLGNGNDSLSTTLAIKKLEAELARENRRFILDQKKDERLWQLELKKLESQEREAQARIDAEKNKYAMLAALPEQIGGAIAKGLIASSSDAGGGAGIQSQPQPKPIRDIEAYQDEAGELPCPVCGLQVGVGPTATNAICAGCGQQFRVRRIPSQTTPAPASNSFDPNPEKRMVTSGAEERRE